jgi:raffinose/stachyose/melibiose transport system substrate-binding protein
MIAFGTWANDFMTHTALNAGAAANGDQFKSQIFLPLAFPDVVGGAKETGRLFGGPDLGWAISAKSKNKDAAFTLVQWLTASKTGQQVMAKTLQIPALKSVPVDNSDVVSLEQKAVLDDQAKQMSNLIGPRQIANADVEAALGQALSAVASGQMSSAAAAKSVQAAIDASR